MGLEPEKFLFDREGSGSLGVKKTLPKTNTLWILAHRTSVNEQGVSNHLNAQSILGSMNQTILRFGEPLLMVQKSG